jgi:hypothetical protein
MGKSEFTVSCKLIFPNGEDFTKRKDEEIVRLFGMIFCAEKCIYECFTLQIPPASG